MLDFTKLELNTAEPVYIQIATFVKQQIFIGAAENGEPFPSRRDIAAILKINPNTVQKAFRLMEEAGLVETPKNSVSSLRWDDGVYNAIRKEMTAGLVQDFVSHEKANGLELEEVLELVKEEWARGEER